MEYIIGNENIITCMYDEPAWKPFDDRVVNFLGALSRNIINDKRNRSYAELIALAYWMRESNLKSIRLRYDSMKSSLGKGIVFHIAPGNVALSFAYSLATGLLTGNLNIIKLASRKFDEADIFLQCLNEVIKDYPDIEKRICIVRYGHDKEVTDKFSRICNMRIIWGGDSTVEAIRKSPLQPRATEMVFADRFSVCIINADKYLKEYNVKKTAHDFYIDTYLTDQNACSSPRIILWLGERIGDAKKIFWQALAKEIADYDMADVTMADKMVTFCKYAARQNAHLEIEKDYRIVRVKIDRLDEGILDYLGNGGYFYEYDMKNLEEILNLGSIKFQTISYIGLEKECLCDLIINNAPRGVDKILPAGKTMEFSFVNDGYDMIREMTREVYVA